MTHEQKRKAMSWASLALDIIASAEARFNDARTARTYQPQGAATIESTAAFMRGIQLVRSAHYVLDEAYRDCAAPIASEKGPRAH